MSKERKPEDLYDSISITCTIVCTECENDSIVSDSDDLTAAGIFFKEGWRASPNKTYCPKCAKKYLKS